MWLRILVEEQSYSIIPSVSPSVTLWGQCDFFRLLFKTEYYNFRWIFTLYQWISIYNLLEPSVGQSRFKNKDTLFEYFCDDWSHIYSLPEHLLFVRSSFHNFVLLRYLRMLWSLLILQLSCVVAASFSAIECPKVGRFLILCFLVAILHNLLRGWRLPFVK